MKYLGLGTAAIGRPLYINISQEKKEVVSLEDFKATGREILEKAYQNGIKYFDTAPGYGMAEELLLDFLQRKNDKEIEIATKWGYTYMANFNPNAIKHEEKEHSLEKLNEQWEYSQKLFPFLTTYQIHSATFETGVLENQAILNRLHELKSKYNLKIGITTTGANQVEVIKKALSVQVENQSLFDVFQVTYNILDQSVFEVMNQLEKENKRVVIKEAMANGRLFPNDKFTEYENLYEVLKKMAQKYQTGIDAIALRFCMDTMQPYSILSGASTMNYLEQNIKSEFFELDFDDINTLKEFAINPADYWKERSDLTWN